MSQRARQGRIAFAASTAAVALAGAFTVWVLKASAYSSGETLLEANRELVVRFAVATPLLVTVSAWVLLTLAWRFGWSRAKTAGTVLAWLLLAFAFVSGFSIGMFVMPAAAALVVGAMLTPAGD